MDFKAVFFLFKSTGKPTEMEEVLLLEVSTIRQVNESSKQYNSVIISHRFP